MSIIQGEGGGMTQFGLRLERIRCSTMDFGQGDLRITHCPFCGSSNLYAAVKERITICECGKRFEVEAFRLWIDDDEEVNE